MRVYLNTKPALLAAAALGLACAARAEVAFTAWTVPAADGLAGVHRKMRLCRRCRPREARRRARQKNLKTSHCLGFLSSVLLPV